jgi:hypothetical protein
LIFLHPDTSPASLICDLIYAARCRRRRRHAAQFECAVLVAPPMQKRTEEK